MKLEHCPFCGAPARLSYGADVNNGLYVIAMCWSCGIRTPDFYYLKDERKEAEEMVAKRWNRRKGDA